MKVNSNFLHPALQTAMLMFLLFLPTFTAAEDIAHKDADLRLYVMGNSLTDELSYDNFLAMARAGGKAIKLGSVRVPGAPIGWLLKHNFEKGGFTHNPYGNPAKAWTDWKWDALTLQPFQWSYDKNTVHSQELMKRLYGNSPEAQVYIYAQWPKNDGGDWTRKWLQPREINIMSRQEHEDTVIWLRENVKEGKPVKLIPAGHVMHVIEQKAKAGQVPGITSMWQAYDDGVHVNNLGNLIVASTYYATLFGESPVGLPVDMFNGKEQKIDLTPELTNVVQESVWEVVATHPMTGVTSDRPIEIITPQLDDAVQNSQYKMEILPAFGKAPRVWSLKSGNLPEGFHLTEDGQITGVSSETGSYEITVAVEGGEGSQAEKNYTLRMVDDTAPEIVGPLEMKLEQGVFISGNMVVKSNNPPLFWSVTGGELPVGLQLTDEGLLKGCAGKPGSYEVQIRVRDGDSNDPETDEATLKITVAESDSVLPARLLADAPEIDGSLDGDPWRFDTPVDNVLEGSVQGKVFLDYGWHKDRLFVAVKVEDDALTGSRWNMKGDNDLVRIFLDGTNNREETYNWDDFIFTLNPVGGSDNQGRTFRTQSKAGAVDGGYVVEISVPFKNLGQPLNSKEDEMPAWRCVGLDVMVVDVDSQEGEPASKVIWKGTEKNLTNPGNFQTLVMHPVE